MRFKTRMEESNFVIDTIASEGSREVGSFNSSFPVFSSSKFALGVDDEADNSDESDTEDDEDYFGLPPPSIRIKDALEQCPIKVEYFKKKCSIGAKTDHKFNDMLLNGLDDYLSELRPKKYSFVTDGIETRKDITKLGMTDNQLKRANKKEREKTNGACWFNMKAPEITDELKNDIQVLQMRSSLDPKHFYKRNEMKSVPKYFEMGQVIESPVEYHNSKSIRKTKKSLVDELLEDAKFQKYNKRKFQETVEQQKIKSGYNKAMKKMKKLKKSKS